MPLKLRLFLGLWSAVWTLGLPLILAYLFRRARKDTLYSGHLAERFGRYATCAQSTVWIHAVSLGEFRSAVPLARAFLERGETVVITCFTPAGRREAEKVFAPERAEGHVHVVWVPLETAWAYRGFFRAFAPKFGLVMEIEIWPRMVFAARAAGVPLFMCNAQYPTKAIARDNGGLRLRQAVMRGFAGAFVKSQLQADRFAAVGVQNIAITGELRFEQPIPPALLEAAAVARPALGLAERRVIAFASTVEGEDETYLSAMRSLSQGADKPFFIYVPRKPERFGDCGALLEAAGFSVARRSTALPKVLDGHAQFTAPTPLPDVLSGDSLGEMYFYLALADAVVVGGGFTPKGAHNIIEPLALKKPVLTGPEIWTIEYPFVEAEAAGVARRVKDAAELAKALAGPDQPTPAQIERFFADHAGGVDRFFAALPGVLANARR
ncbi:3-deoxy-D-manno-octulosonic-acid transferase [Rhodobacter aestuarii]|uniref:3-deoxy-D-manno-octulosonic acid transferase n=1 Tax=Rhodobacter aestuarii TaxID=453582 RepID=A0A1N7Q9H0_9RHOB|nr:glycosyltransferase N-terminal domain-containing protein [Rhodobacter aestuarii]PTV93782.1 3-deoxy-D-manno-octulosonic-acid transferase [Rhodobacter aestuarii]SIT19498.1 3-deoxy-D-manno-octulosonic-acid transferase [Rhodobacter aestuarii]